MAARTSPWRSRRATRRRCRSWRTARWSPSWTTPASTRRSRWPRAPTRSGCWSGWWRRGRGCSGSSASSRRCTASSSTRWAPRGPGRRRRRSMDARKVAAVVRREFVERVRTKWFIISTVLGPIFLVGVTILPAVLATRGGGARIALVDEGSGGFASRLLGQLTADGRFSVSVVTAAAAPATVTDSLTREVQAKRLDGFLEVSPAALESGRFEYRGRNVASIRDMELIRGAVRQAVTVERLTRRGVDPGV